MKDLEKLLQEVDDALRSVTRPRVILWRFVYYDGPGVMIHWHGLTYLPIGRGLWFGRRQNGKN